MSSVSLSAGPIHLGLDTSKNTIVVGILRPEEESPDVERIFNDEPSVRRLVGRFPDCGVLRVCYEAGPTGFGLYRLLRSMGVTCEVIAPSLIPRAPGDRVKTDRRDCRRSVRLHRAGQLVAIRVPTQAEEAVRDLCRARVDMVGDRTRTRTGPCGTPGHGVTETLPPDPGLPTDLGVEVPVWMIVTVLRAAAVRHGRGDGTARTRVRSRRGRWLACHATCLRDAGGAVEQTVVLLSAADPAELAPIITEAYDLTDREQQIIRMIARGIGTAGIAQQLYLSPHTVRDYVKAIFHKVGVSSRGELVAKLYTEFYEATHANDIA